MFKGCAELLLGLSVFGFCGVYAAEDNQLNLSSTCCEQEVSNKEPSWDDLCKFSEQVVCQVFCYSLTPNFHEPYLPHARSGGCSGSGFCISEDGLLLTNYHVVEGAVALFVQFPFGRDRYKVEYISGCQESDIAVLKLTQESFAAIKERLGVDELPYLKLGDSDTVKAGQRLLGVGYPLFQTRKIAFGECSGFEEVFGDKIQTTIPINPGNSGGPVIDNQGLVIGVSSSKIMAEGIEGVGFVIPINNVRALFGALAEVPFVRTPFWGFSFVDLTYDTLKHLGCHQRSGVLLSRVRKLSLFAEAGMKKGDILLEVNGHLIDNHGYVKPSEGLSIVTLYNYLSRLPLNGEVSFIYFRDGEERSVSFTIKQPPYLPIDEWSHWSQPLPDYDMLGGMVFTNLSVNLMKDIMQGAAYGPTCLNGFHPSTIFKYAKLKNRLEPRVCMSVCLPNSQAYKALGRLVETRDCIVKFVNGEEVKTVEDVRQAIKNHSSQGHIVIESEGGVIVALPLEAILNEEELLAQQYGYQPSELYYSLKASLEENEKIINEEELSEEG